MADRTFVDRIVSSRVGVAVMSTVPVPLPWVSFWLTRDNARETAKDGWQRLRDASEQPRYAAVRAMAERYAADGFVLDIGCSQGILQEGLTYGRYLGVDADPGSIALASTKIDARTDVTVGDGSTFVPDERPDVVVLNEVVYYLREPEAVVHHYAGLLAPGGVVIVSIFAHSWASRRLLRRLAQQLTQVEARRATSGQLGWDVVAYRAKAG